MTAATVSLLAQTLQDRITATVQVNGDAIPFIDGQDDNLDLFFTPLRVELSFDEDKTHDYLDGEILLDCFARNSKYKQNFVSDVLLKAGEAIAWSRGRRDDDWTPGHGLSKIRFDNIIPMPPQQNYHYGVARLRVEM